LSQHPGVQECVVVALEVEGDRRLVAYVVPKAGAVLALGDLRRHLGERLPEYMQPSAFLTLDALPLTPNGKVDRNALPPPDAATILREGTPTAPNTSTERRLVELAAPLLGLAEIGIDDNFFLIGGNSLMGARLVAQVSEAYGVALSLRALFEAPTVRQLATQLAELVRVGAGSAMPAAEVAVSHERVVPVQPGGSKRPLFFLHGQWDGRYFYCYPLAEHLGADQPFYALEPYQLDGLAPLPSLEEVAAAHLRSLRAVQPEGPYLLAGWCNGGLVAYEMARQLHAVGQLVDLLVLMDPLPLVYPRTQRLYRAAFSRLGDLLRLGMQRQLETYLRLKHLLRRLYRNAWYRLYKGEPDPEQLSFATLLHDYPRLFDWIALGYAPPTPYPGKITFFWAGRGGEARDFRRGWRHVEQGITGNEVEIHMVPGDHITCRTEQLDAFAEELRKCVATAQAASGTVQG